MVKSSLILLTSKVQMFTQMHIRMEFWMRNVMLEIFVKGSSSVDSVENR